MAETIGLKAVLDLSGFNKGLSSYNKGIGEMSKGTSNFASTAGRQLGDLGGSLLKVGAIAGGAALAGVTALAGGLGAFAVSGISQAKDLDQQMANIAAVMGRTKDEVQPLKDLILELSINPNLKVSATEAADAVELLARNGVSATDILGGMAEATVALANATGADFGTAADLATDVMALFSEQGVTMQQAIDGITGVTTNSKFTVDDYAAAMANMGGAASGLGLDFQQLNALLAATAPTFKSGAEAGTGLRNIFLKLSDPTSEAAELMQQYGISMFDASGNMRDIGEIAGDLGRTLQGTATITQTVGGVTDEMAKAAESAQKKLPALNNTIEEQQAKLAILNKELPEVIRWYGEGSPAVDKHRAKILTLSNSLEENITKQQDMQKALSDVQNAHAETVTTTKKLTDQEKAHIESALGGTRAVSALVAISKIQGDEFGDLTDKVNEQGQAMRAAATRVDSLQGAMEIFKSIIQGVQIQVGDLFLPILKDMLVSFSDIASKQGPRVIDFFKTMITSVQGLFSVFQTGGVSGLIDALGITPEATQLFDKIVSSATSLGQAIISFLLPGLSGLASGGLLDAINGAILFLSQNFEAFKGAIIGIGAVLAGGIFIALATAIFSLLTPINLIIAGAALLGAAWAGNWGNIQGITMSVVTAIQSILMVLVNTFTSVILPQIQAVIANLTNALNSMGLNWTDVWNAIQTAVVIVAAAIGVVILGLISVITGLVAGIASGLATATGYIQAFGAIFTNIFIGLETVGYGFINAFDALIRGDWQGLWDSFGIIVQGAVTLVTGLIDLVVTTFQAALATGLTVINTFSESVVQVFADLFNTLVGNSIVTDGIQMIIDAFANLAGPILDTLGPLAESVSGIFASIFGGGEGEAAMPTLPVIDSETMTAGIQAVTMATQALDTAINNVSLVTIPLLTETFTLLTTLMLTQLITVLTTGVMPLDLAMVTMTTVTIPTLQAAFVTMGLTATNALLPLQAILQTLITLMQTLTRLTVEFAAAAVKAGEDAAKGFEKAAQAIEGKLVKALDKARSLAESLRSALQGATQAAGGLGNALKSKAGLGFSRGMGFQAGIGANTNGLLGLGYRVPGSGFGDTVGPFFVAPQEEMLITPRGTSIEGLIFSRLANLLKGTSVQGGGVTTNNIQNNFNLQVQTTSSAQGTIRQFNVMRGFVGT